MVNPAVHLCRCIVSAGVESECQHHLTPLGARYGATACKRGRRNRLTYAKFANLCKALQRLVITRNEQVSGSGPLVGSLFYQLLVNA